MIVIKQKQKVSTVVLILLCLTAFSNASFNLVVASSTVRMMLDSDLAKSLQRRDRIEKNLSQIDFP